MNIKKEALEKEIQKSIDELEATPGIFCEDRFAIECGDGYEVQIVITTEKHDFIGAVLPEYAKAQPVGG